MTEFYGHKIFLIARLKFGQNFTLFSKARVSQSVLKIPHTAHPRVPLFRQV